MRSEASSNWSATGPVTPSAPSGPVGPVAPCGHAGPAGGAPSRAVMPRPSAAPPEYLNRYASGSRSAVARHLRDHAVVPGRLAARADPCVAEHQPGRQVEHRGEVMDARAEWLAREAQPEAGAHGPLRR